MDKEFKINGVTLDESLKAGQVFARYAMDVAASDRDVLLHAGSMLGVGFMVLDKAKDMLYLNLKRLMEEDKAANKDKASDNQEPDTSLRS